MALEQVAQVNPDVTGAAASAKHGDARLRLLYPLSNSGERFGLRQKTLRQRRNLGDFARHRATDARLSHLRERTHRWRTEDSRCGAAGVARHRYGSIPGRAAQLS